MNYETLCNPVPAADVPVNFYRDPRGSTALVRAARSPASFDVDQSGRPDAAGRMAFDPSRAFIVGATIILIAALIAPTSYFPFG
jgi:hypothetical protein